MKIATLNINGIRAGFKNGLADWLLNEKPNVVCLQEIKADENTFPFRFLEELGYRAKISPAEKKGYSGVGMLFRKDIPIRKDIPEVKNGSGSPLFDREGRLQRAEFPDFTLINAYFPSGSSGEGRQEMKMKFLDEFDRYIGPMIGAEKPLIIAGDLNICHHPIDIHNPVSNKKSPGFLPEEREWLGGLLNRGLADTWRHFHREEQAFTWWTYRFNARAKNLGWRIDYVLVSPSLLPRITDCRIDSEVFLSDHVPVVLELK